ncbi:10598_t:CDS:2 [Funneliformis geosporum]|uniref:13591_t:CDS:1 n=1 Tax=Funneliformis geosporum TaxID=1117311 RepID=A0A9W4WZK4_9GLOM|nr:10598_t:CDS:2 [Funneliformis geosporum]CAI2175338.1 13591_t:CDS:2 [Funneliformis geosporum]
MSDLFHNAHSIGTYTIIVCGQTFRLTTTALYSDSPNFFTEVFSSHLEESRTKIMFIDDRDPEIFKDIVKHLRGYYITPRDEIHYTDLFTDANYYNLSKLKTQLRSNYIVNVGGKVFRVEREILEKRDAPNFFTSFGFGYGWEPSGMPPIPLPPSMPPPILDRDPELFSDILRYLQGYEIGIKDEVHRQNLLKDSRFYHLKGLTEKLLASSMTVNGFAKDDSAKNEILFRLKDIRHASVLLLENNNGDIMISDESSFISTGSSTSHVMYKNKEGAVYVLLVEVHNVNLICRYGAPSSPYTATTTPITNPATPVHLSRMLSLRPTLELSLSDKDMKKLKNIAKSIKASEEIVTTIQSPDTCAFEIDNNKCALDALSNTEKLLHLMKTDHYGGRYLTLYVTRAILRLLVKNGKIEMEMLKCEAFSSERGFNYKREFLPDEKSIAL